MSIRTIAGGCSLLMGLALAGCSSTSSKGAGVAASMMEMVSTPSHIKEAQRKAEQQAEIQAFEEAQLPQQAETETRYLQLVEQMQQQGLWFASLAHIDALEARWTVSDASRLLRADALRNVGHLQSSQVLYQALIKTAKAGRAWHGLGLLAAGRGDFEQAVKHLQSAQKLMPTDALLLNDLGYALLHTLNGISAGLPLKQAAQLRPDHPRIQSNVAVYLVLYGQEHEALAWMARYQMNEAQRLGVFERAQRIASTRASASGVIAVELQPKPIELSADRQQKCAHCLIFEHQLPSVPSAL